MGDDLYTTPAAQTPVVTQTTNTTPTLFDLGLDLELMLYWLNVIVLAWTVFYSVVFVVDFFFYRIKYPDGELEAREKVGVQSMYQAAGLWWGFLICAVLYVVFLSQPEGITKGIIGWLTVIAYLLKVIVADMPTIPVIGGFLGKPGDIVQDFVENLSKNTQKFLAGVVDAIVDIFSPSS
jgi:hypothetical protein